MGNFMRSDEAAVLWMERRLEGDGGISVLENWSVYSWRRSVSCMSCSSSRIFILWCIQKYIILLPENIITFFQKE